MRKHLNIPVLLALVALLLTAGCERGDTVTLSSELDEPYYRQGQQLAKQGRTTEALNSYLKVITKRDETAPESHLEAGLIFLRHVKDPVAAIYHFRKYLELQPNSKQAIYVSGLIEAARREYAKTLAAAPQESQTERLETQDQIERLLRENEQIKAELAALRAGVSSAPPIRTRQALDPNASGRASISISVPAADPPPSTVDDSPVTYAPVETPVVETAPSIQPSPPPSGKRLPPTKPTAPSGRRHTVTKGDTLFSISRRYYGDATKRHAIFEANRDVLSAEGSPLRLGTELKIP